MESSENYDDPIIEQSWLEDQKQNVKKYLLNESINYTEIPEAKWFVAPYISVWNIKPNLWIISGDLPTDYIQDENITNASEAAKYFAKRWLEISSYLLKGKQHPDLPVGKSQEPKELKEMGLLLQKRASLILKWVDDSTI